MMFSAAQGNLKKIKTSRWSKSLWGNVLGSARPSDVCKHRSICGRLTFDHILVLYLANVCEAMSTSSVSCYNTLSVRVYNLSIEKDWIFLSSSKQAHQPTRSPSRGKPHLPHQQTWGCASQGAEVHTTTVEEEDELSAWPEWGLRTASCVNEMLASLDREGVEVDLRILVEELIKNRLDLFFHCSQL